MKTLSYIHNSDYTKFDLTSAIDVANGWYKLYRKYPRHIETYRLWQLAEQQLDFILDNYLARKGELHTTNEEKTYVTRKPLWWLSEDGRNVKQRI